MAEIFARHGEPHFRAAERDILKLVQPMRNLVVATGGGTFADPDNRTAINLDGVSVWIDLPLADLIPRIPMDGRRPLASDRAQLERLYALRVEAYRAAVASRGRVSHVHVQDRGPHPRGHSPPALGRSPADAPRVSPCAT